MLAPAAQTTVGDLGFAARSVGISLGPGLVASQRAEPKRRSSRPIRQAALLVNVANVANIANVANSNSQFPIPVSG